MENLRRISADLHRILYGRRQPTPPTYITRGVQENLKAFSIDTLQDLTDATELPVPEWMPTTNEFFQEAAESYLAMYRKQLQALSRVITIPCYTPSTWAPVGKWSRYVNDRWVPITVPPGESGYVLDFETVEIEPGAPWLPTCAVAVRALESGDTELYVWRQNFDNPIDVVPFSGDNVITGWNVCAYDRALLACEYGVKPSGNVFPDLMSMHIKSRGLCNQQVSVLKLAERVRDAEEYEGGFAPDWTYITSGNSLSAAYKLYTGGKVDKGVRDEIVKLGLPWVRDNMHRVIEYCIKDVLVTLELWNIVYPEYSGYPSEFIMNNSRNPSPVSLAGFLIKSTSFVPLAPDRWDVYYANAERVYKQRNLQIETMLAQRAKELYNQYAPVHSEVVEVLESIKGLSRCKPSESPRSAYQKHLSKLNALGYTADVTSSDVITAFLEHMDVWSRELNWTPVKGLPTWYCDQEFGLNKRITPLLLKLTWKGEPVRYTEERGWHTSVEDIPHPTDADKKNRALFSKDMKPYFDDKTIDSPDAQGLTELMVLFNSTINWRSMRKRVKLIRTVKVDGVPYMVLDALQHGTQTGREASKTLHVFPHTKPAEPSKGKLDGVGTSFMSHIQALPGYDLVSIDFDSQELVLFMLAGCEPRGYVGSTPLSMMVLCGQASNKTDFHSVTMQQTGITNRTLVKNLNYAGCYNSGRATQIKTLLKGNPDLGLDVASAIESKWRKSFVGDREYGEFRGGSASDSFNVLRKRADAPELTTLFGGCKLSKAISGVKDYMTTRFNAVIQATGATMLDHILVGTSYLAAHYNVDTRYAFNRHDEWVFHTAQEHRMLMAYLMQIVHMYVWAQLVWEMGLDTLPLNLAYASAVQASANYLKTPDAITVTEDHPYQCPPALVITKQQIAEWVKCNPVT